MSFLGTLLTVLWDQVSSLHRPSQLERLFRRYAAWLLPRFNAGTSPHAYLAWAVAALPPALLAGLVGVWLSGYFFLAGLFWSALVLYQCLGFRQMTELARGVADASEAGDSERVRSCLAEWGCDVADADDAELAGRALDAVFVQGLHRVFGAVFWFVLFGPGGALCYAAAVLVESAWRGKETFRLAAGQIVEWLDWLPARLLALSFALVGNFEESVLHWRERQGGDGRDSAALLARIGRGALGLSGQRLGRGSTRAASVMLKRVMVLWLAVLGLLWLGTL